MLKHREVVQLAKEVVLFRGPWTVIEFATSMVEDHAPELSDEDRDRVIEEAVRQSDRVIKFMGIQ